MRVGAGRWILRQGSRPYGVQQARNLHNARKRDEGIPGALALQGLLWSVKSSTNKGWARPVPASAVTLAARVVVVFIGLKASVAGLASPL